MNPEDFARLANNFYFSKGLESNIERIALDADLINYYSANQNITNNKYKVALVFICLNPLYWQYAPEMVRGARQLFLPGHKTDYLFWTDIPENEDEIKEKISNAWTEKGQKIEDQNVNNTLQIIVNSVSDLRKKTDIFIYPTDSVEWPYPTLRAFGQVYFSKSFQLTGLLEHKR